ncbi:MAG: SH3 domain-containing protein [Thermodesulfobacteriota bacterium]
MNRNVRMRFAVWLTSLLLVMALFGPGSASAAERMSVQVKLANIRSGPSTDYSILWKVEKFYPLKVVEKSGKWYKFTDFEGDKGWIYAPLVDSTDTVVVSRENCNVRSGPSTDTEVKFTADKGVPFKVLERKGKWLHIQHSDGEDGWIYESLVW